VTVPAAAPSEVSPLAVVTGAGSGIGAAIVRELVARGARVVVTDLDGSAADAVAAEAGAEASYQLDVTDVAACGRVADRVATTHGGLDVWVSNAGVSRMRPVLEITEAEYEHTLGVNLKGIFFASQAAARVMAEAGSGVIVNVASMAGKQGRVPFLADYVASKFGVVGVTQAMAFELAPMGIRVNCVCPGYVATPMQDRELAWEAELRGVAPDTVRELWIADTPMGRLEQPEDVARAVAFLVGPDAAFITGEALAVNGGAFMD
jgi:meso-butanediol dehydrogenase / (S,S)-butanediol dehydrogenase / diacetyl reductase